ncbi:MAG: PP2C family protein-serine/threonine phosphatase [Pseudomonadota bacterium]
MVITSKLYFANLTISLICATTLAIISVLHTNGTITALAVLIVLVLFLCQLILVRSHSRQLTRADRYQRLGRKLLQLKRNKKRDESMAIRVLNHIVQQSTTAPTHCNIWQKPLETFSGDLALTTRSDNGSTYTLLADLTGHGIAAAMGATPVASIFQATARRALPIEQIVVELNEKLRRLLPPGYFCCATIICCRNGEVRVCNAGLPSLRVVTSQGAIIETIDSAQLPLGIDELSHEDVAITSRSYPQDTRIYAFTDGLTEATDLQGDIFDEACFDRHICTECPPQGRLPHIKERFDNFVKGSTANDDISIVEVKIC